MGKNYVVVLMIFYNYNFATKTGIFEIIDVQHSNLNEGLYTAINCFLIQKPSQAIDPHCTHPCDLNGNNNVTFAECMKCMFNACRKDRKYDALCGMYITYCMTSMEISCGILSIIY
ncbi:MAG: hypothetical protein C4308_05730 [Chitinophagaceae bacterium]